MNNPFCSFKMGKFFAEGGAIAPNAPTQLRHWLALFAYASMHAIRWSEVQCSEVKHVCKNLDWLKTLSNYWKKSVVKFFYV